MNKLNQKELAMVLLLLAASPLVTATEEQSTIDILMSLLTPGGTSQGPP